MTDASEQAPHRRDITVLMSDLTDFTAMAETAEPEVVFDLIGQYHARIGDVIGPLDGWVLDYTGDGVAVMFNDPVEVPDPELRAVRAAVGMRERTRPILDAMRAHGSDLGLKIGIASGYATLGHIGVPGQRHYAAIGRTLIAAAMATRQAHPGQILVTQRVLGAVEDHVEAEPAGEITRFRRPLAVFNIVALRA